MRGMGLVILMKRITVIIVTLKTLKFKWMPLIQVNNWDEVLTLNSWNLYKYHNNAWITKTRIKAFLTGLKCKKWKKGMKELYFHKMSYGISLIVMFVEFLERFKWNLYSLGAVGEDLAAGTKCGTWGVWTRAGINLT